MIPDAAVKHYRQMQRLQALAVLSSAGLWSEVRLSDLSGSWAAQIPLLVPVLAGVQVRAAAAGASYGAATLAEQGLHEAPQHFVNPTAFGGIASDGRTLEGLLYSAVPKVKVLIGGGMDPRQALVAGEKFLTTVMRTQVADAGRGAAGVDVATRKNVGYVRFLNPPSCSRCSILAGKFYKWNIGFRRHPKCDCTHAATTATAALESEGLIHDPYEYFKSLSPEDQDKYYSKAGAQAIRDGADIFQVVNADRGMKPGGLITTEGTSKRGNYGRGRMPRLTPEGIYAQNLSRADTLKLLETNGYLFPGGQNPYGVIRGQVESSKTGGLTAAERRLRNSALNWEAVLAGRNPLGKSPLTLEIKAQVETDYRGWLSTSGQVFK